MTLTKRAREISELLKNKTDYASVFGCLTDTPKIEQRQALTESFRRLALSIHPDKSQGLPGRERQFAEETFKRLVDASKNALKALDEGLYSAPVVESPKRFPLTSQLTSYFLENDSVAMGDFSKVYSGQSLAGLDVLVKISRDSESNQCLEREVEFLEVAHSKKSLMDIHPFIPETLDTFLIEHQSQFLRAIVFEGITNNVSMRTLIDAYPGGMPPADAAWVARRMLAQVCAASMLGVVHGALIPDHLIVGVETHNPLHIGWSHSVPVGDSLNNLYPTHQKYYSPEILRGEELDCRSDLYMAGKTIIELLGGDLETNWLPSRVPSAIASVVLRCVKERAASRYYDGPDALDAFSQAAWSLWGKSYRRLEWPPHR